MIGCPALPVHAASANHLDGQTSPYLLQHAHDPVDWYPWSDEAFARAKRENKAVFVSSGFASCHWCHVMQRESFTDAATAKILNDSFISIMIDREERPDIDQICVRAAQAVGGRAGWPLTVFMTPDKKPFFAGTYYPKVRGRGLPAFTSVLNAVLKTWRERRDVVEGSARVIERSAGAANAGGSNTANVTENIEITPAYLRSSLLRAQIKLNERADVAFGGLLGDRKYPTPGVLQFALLDKNQKYLTTTLDHLRRGGIRDQLRGGFFRFSTDEQWHQPHYEKMLVDNALLAQIYLRAGEKFGRKDWVETGLDTVDFCLTNLRTPEGAFWGSIDAESGGLEGAYYKYSPVEIEKVLGAKEGKSFCTTFSIIAPGSVLYAGDASPDWEKRSAASRRKVLGSALVAGRRAPLVDKKVVNGWNALMVSTLLDAYRVSSDKKYLDAARKCQAFLQKNLSAGTALKRVWAGGKASIDGCLDDYAFSIRALLDLYELEKDPRLLQRARDLNKYVLAHFVGPRVGFFYTGNNSDQSTMRAGCAEDNYAASPAAIEISNLLRLSKMGGEAAFLATARSALRLYSRNAEVDPAAYGYLLCAERELLDLPDPSHRSR